MSPRTPRQPETLGQLIFSRAGVVRGMRVVKFISEWVLVSNDLGGGITVAQYLEFMGLTTRTGERKLADFRVALPELSTPEPLAERARELHLSRLGVEGVANLPSSIAVAV